MSLLDTRNDQTDHDFRYLEDWVNSYQPELPKWHRGVCWSTEVQRKFVESWLNGEVTITLHIGYIQSTDKKSRNEGVTYFLDGFNGWQSIRMAMLGKLDVPDFAERLKGLRWGSRTYRAVRYNGTLEQLQHVTYLLNRGSPCAWSKETLQQIK